MSLPLATVPALLAAFFAYPYVASIVWNYAVKKYTIVKELESLGIPRQDGKKFRGAVVIAGGGGAGMITAAMLTRHFEKIVVIEPEEWVNTEEGMRYEKPKVAEIDGLRAPQRKRKRVPQFLSLHTWAPFLLSVLRRLFPRWDQVIKENTGIIEPYGYNSHYSGISLPDPTDHYPLGLPDSMFFSRALFEPMLRYSLRTVYPQVEYLTGSVVGVNKDKVDGSKIGSVSYRSGGEEETRTIDVVFFIDCAGPIQAGLKWLSAAGFGKPDPSQPNKYVPLDALSIRYNQKMKASTSYWPVPPSIKSGIDLPAGGYTFVGFPIPGNNERMYGIGRLEDDQVLIMCSAWGDHIPMPRSLDETRAFIVEDSNQLVPVPDHVIRCLDELKEFEDQAVWELYTLPPCSWAQYSKASNLPCNYVAIGDSCMSVNPVFGQGFYKVSGGVLILDSMLRALPTSISSFPPNFSKDFFKDHEDRLLAPIWEQTKSQDYAFPTTIPVPGESLSQGKFGRWFGHHLILATASDKELAAKVWHVRSYLWPGILLFAPSIWIKVLAQWWSGKIPGLPQSSTKR